MQEKEYCVQMDVTFTGCVYIKALNEEQAKEKASWINFVPSDLRDNHFCWLESDVIEVNTADESL